MLTNTFSYSQISTFQRCQYLYQRQYIDGWETTPTPPLVVGDMVHVGMNAYRHGQNPLHVMDAYFREKYLDQNIPELGDKPLDDTDRLVNLKHSYRILAGGIRILADNFVGLDNPDGSPMAETKLEWDLLENWTDKEFDPPKFTGVVDWVAREKSTGHIWLFDYKVRKTIVSDENEDYSLQMAIYQYILNRLGIPVVGSIMFQMRSSPMDSPRLNNNGTMSRADIVCDWVTYKKELMKHGLNPADYSDMEQKLGGKKFYVFTKSYRSTELLDRIWQQIVVPAVAQIQSLRDICYWDAVGKHRAVRSMSMMCRNCQMLDRCQADLRGLVGGIQLGDDI